MDRRLRMNGFNPKCPRCGHHMAPWGEYWKCPVDGTKVEKEKPVRDLPDYTDEELYHYKARLQRQRISGRGPEQSHQRYHRKIMLRRVNAALKQRGLPVRIDGRTYATAAHIAIIKAT